MLAEIVELRQGLDQVISEAVTSAAKHADAGELRVGIRRRHGVLRIEVRGHWVSGASPGNGAGLRGIADRVDALGGRVTIDRPIRAGTLIAVELCR